MFKWLHALNRINYVFDMHERQKENKNKIQFFNYFVLFYSGIVATGIYWLIFLESLFEWVIQLVDRIRPNNNLNREPLGVFSCNS